MLPVIGESDVSTIRLFLFWVGNSSFSLRNKCRFPENQDKSMQNIIPINVVTKNNSSNRTCNELIGSIFGNKKIHFAFIYDGIYIWLLFLSRQFSRQNFYLEEDQKGRFLSTKSDRNRSSTLTHDISPVKVQ